MERAQLSNLYFVSRFGCPKCSSTPHRWSDTHPMFGLWNIMLQVRRHAPCAKLRASGTRNRPGLPRHTADLHFIKPPPIDQLRNNARARRITQKTMQCSVLDAYHVLLLMVAVTIHQQRGGCKMPRIRTRCAKQSFSHVT